MKLKVDDITAEAKLLFFLEPELEINQVLGEGQVGEPRFEAPTSVRVSYYRAGTEIFFEGTLTAHTRAVCARCTEEFSSSTARAFKFVVGPRSIGGSPAPSPDDVGYALYEGDEIDLSPLIREELLLSLPTRPLCREDCQGLCSQCGANLNDDSCDCPAPAADSRLAVLRTLKIQRS